LKQQQQQNIKKELGISNFLFMRVKESSSCCNWQ